MRWDLTLTIASGDKIKVLGYIDLQCSTVQGSSTMIQALVVEDCEDDVLLSWHDLVALGSIPDTFPFPFKIHEIHNEWCKVLASGLLKDNDEMLDAEIAAAKDSIQKQFRDVMNDSLHGSVIKCEPMKISLDENLEIVPLKVWQARPVPLHHVDSAKRLIKELVDTGVIEPVDWPTAWVSPAHFVAKQGTTDVRLVTDFSHLNRYIKRPAHPFMTGQEILRTIDPRSKFFAKLDLVKGYYQVELDVNSRDYTCFLLPSGLGDYAGRWRYRRGPMGLSSTGDIFCQITDRALQGTSQSKLVDDIFIQDATLNGLISKLVSVLTRCRETGIIVSKRKFKMGTSVPFAGSIVTRHGNKVDARMTQALRDFPVPKNITDLRSFLGLANQFSHHSPDLCQVTAQMRRLLKKNTDFQWLEVHQVEFERVKQILTSAQFVCPFDPTLHSYLLTDASRIGLGYVLLQYGPDQKPRIIKCGSTSLTDCQTRYAVIELEALAIQWAIQHCEYFLLGCKSFSVITDHAPLVGVFRKDIRDVGNSRLQRIREKIASYNFTVEWQAGKLNNIADALSRYPVFKGVASEITPLEFACMAKATREEPSLRFIFEQAKTAEYRAIVKALRGNIPLSSLPTNHPARILKSVWDRLSLLDENLNTLIMLDGKQIFVPKSARSDLLKIWHKAHAGFRKTKLLAQEAFFWPGMVRDIKQSCDGCEVCVSLLPSKPHKPRQGGTPVSALTPMEEVSLDLFHYNGDWLILVDRYSGYFMVHKLKATSTADVKKVLDKWFATWGNPRRIRADFGPQFRSEFNQYCEERNIEREQSSAYHHESAGLAESGVKNAKRLIEKCAFTGENLELAIADWLNTPNSESGVKPSFLFFGRSLRTRFPHVETEMTLQEAETKRELSMLSDPQPESKFKVGDRVIVQNLKTKRWTEFGEIIEIRSTEQSYHIKFDDGSIKLRNARFIKKDTVSDSAKALPEFSLTAEIRPDGDDVSANGHKECGSKHDDVTAQPLRRSKRLQQKAVQFS